ncbi:unnamed protein product, partial [Ixodes hexagonus]
MSLSKPSGAQFKKRREKKSAEIETQRKRLLTWLVQPAQLTRSGELHEPSAQKKLFWQQQADDSATRSSDTGGNSPDELQGPFSTPSSNQKDVSDDDPSREMPTNDIDKQARQARGPFQPHLS